MSNLFRAVQAYCAKLVAKTTLRGVAALPSAPFNPVVAWGRSFEERYKRWDKEGKPTRPSSQEIDIYKKYIGALAKEKKILILGPTPELRDAAAGHAVVVADLSPVCIEEATNYLTAADPNDERHVIGNWLSLPFPDGYFDVILGDMVLNQFPPGEEERRFLDEMHRLCAAEGKFISRCITTDPNFLPEHLPEAVRRCVAAPFLSRRETIAAIANLAITCTPNRSLRLNNLYGAWTVLEDLLRVRGVDRRTRSAVRDAIRYLKDNGFPGGRWWSFPSGKELAQLLTAHSFIIGEHAYALDQPFGRFLPVVNCAPKKSTH